jgi:hypothetical protein
MQPDQSLPHAVAISILALVLGADLHAQTQVTLPVLATMDLYQAGGYDDGGNGIAPAIYSFRARAGQILTFSSVSGSWSCHDGDPGFSADGETSGYCLSAGGPTNINPIGPFSGYQLTDFTGALAGIFLEDSLPTSAPQSLRFYVADNSQGGIQTSFSSLSPAIGQVFFIGDGLTATGIGRIQSFRVPPTATHLYLGYIDNCKAPNNTVPGCYSDNVGSVTAVFQLIDYELNWVEPQLTSAPSARCCAGMAYDAATQSTVLFGGGNGGVSPPVRNADTWVWTGKWSQQFPSASPLPRQGAAMAYDPSTGTVVLFGGGTSDNTPLNDTWTWDGVTWTQQFPPVSPPAREIDTQGMAYDAVTGTVVLFGGANDKGGVLDDTWEWDGKVRTWTQRFPASSPSARKTVLAFDAARGDIVLFGGDNGGNDIYADTWTWNGENWTQQFPASAPSARTLYMMAYDPSLGEIVLFGGTVQPPQGLNDTWTWDGSTWTQKLVATSPGGRWSAAFDVDPAGKGLMLFGGEQTGDPFTNQTWLFTFAPVR